MPKPSPRLNSDRLAASDGRWQVRKVAGGSRSISTELEHPMTYSARCDSRAALWCEHDATRWETP